MWWASYQRQKKPEKRDDGQTDFEDSGGDAREKGNSYGHSRNKPEASRVQKVMEVEKGFRTSM